MEESEKTEAAQEQRFLQEKYHRQKSAHETLPVCTSSASRQDHASRDDDARLSGVLSSWRWV
jgi:hypothetical protein